MGGLLRLWSRRPRSLAGATGVTGDRAPPPQCKSIRTKCDRSYSLDATGVSDGRRFGKGKSLLVRSVTTWWPGVGWSCLPLQLCGGSCGRLSCLWAGCHRVTALGAPASRAYITVARVALCAEIARGSPSLAPHPPCVPCHEAGQWSASMHVTPYGINRWRAHSLPLPASPVPLAAQTCRPQPWIPPTPRMMSPMK